ncbi:agouti-signaling protein-like [Solea senegalensis]|uniref:Agouti-signaling protein-like n=1 Tax=Solea senegalensis TaxID=28829 RepID=A0AAV6T7W5_SOLSE|nr:agouti-signaling protein 2b [Solea senegalensis]KAG7525527.1 agouti-signaling protein-like [Solea senegalensis]
MKISGKHLLCFFLLSLPLSWAEDTKQNERNTENNAVLSPAKSRRLFARQKISSSKENRIPKRRSDSVSPARRCGHLMDSCSSRVPCCDPCASCRCRLFNSVCHCWRMSHVCLKRA